MVIIDSQVHSYEANTPQRPWFKVPDWPAHVTGDEMMEAMDKVGVDGAILVSAFSMYQFDPSYAAEVQRAHADRLAVISPVDPDDPAVVDIITEWKKNPGAVGIRVLMHKDGGHAPDDPGFDRVMRAAARLDLPVNVQCWDNLDVGIAVFDRHPETRFALDHMGIIQPYVPPVPPDAWANLPKVLDLARRPNVVIKVSGACTLSREPFPYPDMWDPLARIFEAWGLDRCLWGTDWTRTAGMLSYNDAVQSFRQSARLSESERAMLMGGACAKFYGWSPKAG